MSENNEQLIVVFPTQDYSRSVAEQSMNQTLGKFVFTNETLRVFGLKEFASACNENLVDTRNSWVSVIWRTPIRPDALTLSQVLARWRSGMR